MTRGRRRLAGTRAGVLVLLVDCTSADARRPESPPPASPQDHAAGGAAAARGFHSVSGYRATPIPAWIEIPAIHVASVLDRLGRAPDGTVEEPSRWEVPGWFQLGPRPGDPGSAVILGHVDSKRGPAVFFRLRELRPGDRIGVTRADGSPVRFVAQRTATYDKQRFPTDNLG